MLYLPAMCRLYAFRMSDNRGKRLDFKYIDGLRAIAAIAVVLFHAYLFTGHNGDAESKLPGVFKLIGLGDFAVPMFIVLSGFVLMLPIAKSRGLRLRGGLMEYIKRRAKRILPPYYAALALFGVLILLVPVLATKQDTAWDSKIPVTWDGVLSHLLVIHNFNADWIYQINGPAWSVATEWQLYFALPLLLLPIWRKLGRVGVLVSAFAIAVAVALFLPALAGAHFWFIALFAMGALAAHTIVTERHIPRLGLITTAAWVVTAGVIGATKSPVWVTELILGAAMALSVLWMARRIQDNRRTPLHAFLESKPLVKVGGWSYSLYLIHSPILALGNLLLLDVQMPTIARFGIQVLVVAPIAAGLGYVFHLLVERRFLTSHQKQVVATQPEPDRVTVP